MGKTYRGLSRIGSTVEFKPKSDELTGKFYVKVFDYDGTQLGKTVWLNNGDTYKLEIEPPTHDRLVFANWCCTQDIVDNTVIIENQNVLIGATYNTVSGLNELEIELTPDIAPNIEVDGFVVSFNTTSTFNRYWDYGNDTTTSDKLQSHTYYSYGRYIIAFSGNPYFGSSGIFGQKSANPNWFLKEVRCSGLGNSQSWGLDNGALNYCYGLTTLSNGDVTYTNLGTIDSCHNLKCIIGKRNTYTRSYENFNLETLIIQKNAFTNYTTVGFYNIGSASSYPSLTNYVIPKGFTEVGGNEVFFSNNKNKIIRVPEQVTNLAGLTVNNVIEELYLPNNLKSVNNVQQLYQLKKIHNLENTKISTVGQFGYLCPKLEVLKFPATLTSITGQCFKNMIALKYVDLSRCLQVVTLSRGDVFLGVPPTAKVIVPDEFYKDYIIATNWVNEAFRIIKASEVQL